VYWGNQIHDKKEDVITHGGRGRTVNDIAKHVKESGQQID
jgi:hypothetical protein